MSHQIQAPGKGQCWKCLQVERWKRPCRRCGAKLCSKCVPSRKAMEICILCRDISIPPPGQQQIPPQPTVGAMHPPPSSHQAAYKEGQSVRPPAMHPHAPQGAVQTGRNWQGGNYSPVPLDGQQVAMEQHAVSQPVPLYPTVQMLIGQAANLQHRYYQPPPGSQTVHPPTPYQHAPPPQSVGLMGQTPPGQSILYQQPPPEGQMPVPYLPSGTTQSTLVMSASQHHTGERSQSVMGSSSITVETVTMPDVNLSNSQTGGLHAGKSRSIETAPGDMKEGGRDAGSGNTSRKGETMGRAAVYDAGVTETPKEVEQVSDTGTHTGANWISDVTHQMHGILGEKQPEDSVIQARGPSMSHFDEAAASQETLPPFSAYQSNPSMGTGILNAEQKRVGNQWPESDKNVDHGRSQRSVTSEPSEKKTAPWDEHQIAVHREQRDQDNQGKTRLTPQFQTEFGQGAEASPQEPPPGYPSRYSGMFSSPVVSEGAYSQQQYPTPPPGYPTAAPVSGPHTVKQSRTTRFHRVRHVPSSSPPEERLDPEWSPLAARLKALGKLPRSEPHQEASPGAIGPSSVVNQPTKDSSRRSHSRSQPEVISTGEQGGLHRYASVPAPTHLVPDIHGSMEESEEDDVKYAGQSKVQERLSRLRRKDQFSRALLLLQGAGAEDFLEPLTIVLERLGFSIDVLHSHSPLTRPQIVERLEALTHGLTDGCQVFLCVFSESEGGVAMSSKDIQDKLLNPSNARVNVVTHVLIDGMRGMDLKYELKKYRSVRAAELIGWWEDRTPAHQRIMKKHQPVQGRNTFIQICADRGICGYIPGSLICAVIDVLNKKKYLSYTSLFDELEVAIGEATQLKENYTPSLVDEPSPNRGRSTREPITLTVAGFVLPVVGLLATNVRPLLAEYFRRRKADDNDARWRGGIVFSSLNWMDGDEMAKFDWCA